MEKNSPIKSFIAGAVGGTCTVFVGHPFDTVKVRLQTMPKPKPGELPPFSGAVDCLKKTVQKEGFLALYKGMAVPIAGVAPLFAVYFGGCAIGKKLQSTHPDQEMTFYQNFFSGALAGVFTTVIMAPGERIKCLLQIQNTSSSDPKKIRPMELIKKLYADGGIRSLYRGTGATLLRDIPASGAYLSVYEYLKKKLSDNNDGHLSPLAIMTAGGFAGVANWGVCIPADVLKSRLQTAPEGKYPNGIRGVFKEVMLEEGPKGLFKGFTPVMMRAFPANAACFFGFELTMKGMHMLF
ncbi:Mitochondrial carnitine/acylcarnitine carrier protein [Strongyloides ratti]|uniref:Mitochondrial carnitine/acylcarnitine carrier protein n=1 Tax=Strongyloides ratti TaxID=34506 RepID=A0A090KUQ6_STRRB|nr:Mitochondrial carnitine/acylcarnitine carrier protein [Strongyloides ratti]CEF59605.1 Mitochondrial carnitine/acylcarnitine carrier protein [Strongyloides ratti]